MKRIESGLSGGIVVAKLDRFGRSLPHGLAAIGRIEHAGGVFISVADGFDLRTPTGKLMARMMLAWAEWELERIRINAQVACERAVSRGVYIARKGPPGYLRDSTGRLVPDPETAPLIVEAFRRRANGARAVEIARFLNASGYGTPSGRPLRQEAIYPIISNRAYVGESHYGDYRKLGAHPPLVDRRTWELAQFQRNHSRDPTKALLALTIRCASCGRSMVSYAPQTKRSPTSTYRCYRGARSHGKDCPAPAAVSAEEIEPLVEEYVISQARWPDLEARWPSLPLAARKAQITRCLEAVVIERGREPVADRSWLCPRRAEVPERGWNERIAPFDLANSEAERPGPIEQWPPGRLETELEEFLSDKSEWPTFPQFSAAGRARLHQQAMTYGGPYWWGPRLGIEIPPRFVIWNEERVRGALRPFLLGRERFPTEGEFRRAGLASLRRAIEKHGGVAHWADEFGLESGSCGGRWSKDLVARELVDFLGDRRHFPTKAEFRRRGKINLFNAAKRHGGIPYWQRRFELRAAVWSRHSKSPPPGNELAQSPLRGAD